MMKVRAGAVHVAPAPLPADSIMNIVVTGASGHLGLKLATHLSATGHRVTGIDLLEGRYGASPIHVADLSCYAESWAGLLGGQQVIIHLAADRAPDACWDGVIPHNIDAVLNLFEAARRNNVPRIVFASSNWVLGGYRFSDKVLDAVTTPHPVNPYGMSKLMGERIGEHYADVHGMTVIAVRIGWTQRTHGNQPGPHMAMGRWGQLMWLSDRDFLDGMTAAATASASGFKVVNLMSNNKGMQCSLKETREVTGFEPSDGSPASLPFMVRLREYGAWLKQVGMARLMKRLTKEGW